MAFFPTYTREQIVELMVGEYSGQATIPADTSEGSGLNSIFNAKALASVGIFQAQAIYVASIARLGTIPVLSSGPNPDVDSFVNPFNIFRQQAQPSTGQVVFSTSSALAQSILIPAVVAGSSGGVIVQTTSGVQFQVIVDTTNSAYNATLGGYVIAATTGTTGGSVSCTVQCLSDGTSGNVAANQITQLFSGPGVTSIAGVGSVTNPAAFTNAAAVETDIALKARFAKQLSTGVTATLNAAAAAVLGVQLNLTYSIGDCLNAAGATQNGYYTVVVNNANTATAPTSNLLTAVYAACLTAKPLGITFQTIAPTLVAVNIAANIKVAPGYTSAAVVTACTAAWTAYVNGIGLDPAGATTYCTIARVYATLVNTPGVADVTSLTLNGGTVDVAASFAHQCIAGTVAFSPYS